jgi:methyltransferase family protein
MSSRVSKLRAPRADDRRLWDVMLGIWGYPAVMVAHELKLFELLDEKPLTLEEICKMKRLARRPAETLLALCASLGLLSLRRGRYSLTALSREYIAALKPVLFRLVL